MYVPLNTKRRIEVALAGLVILETLEATDRTMTHGDFARRIGLLGPREAWKPWHRDQVSDTLNLIAAVARKAGDRINFERIVNARTGQPGAGATSHQSRIVTN